MPAIGNNAAVWLGASRGRGRGKDAAWIAPML